MTLGRKNSVLTVRILQKPRSGRGSHLPQPVEVRPKGREKRENERERQDKMQTIGETDNIGI